MDLPQRLVAEAVQAPAPAPAIDYWALQEINKEINGGPYRDCEWFTHFKIQKLKEMGIPAEKLYVATETTDADSPNHVVAVVGDWVLDNRHKRVLSRKQMEKGGYRAYPGYVIPPGGTPKRSAP